MKHASLAPNIVVASLFLNIEFFHLFCQLSCQRQALHELFGSNEGVQATHLPLSFLAAQSELMNFDDGAAENPYDLYDVRRTDDDYSALKADFFFTLGKLHR